MQPRHLTLTVALDGADTNPGTDAHPFATLERAREAIRQLKQDGAFPAGGITVELRQGVYSLVQPFTLAAGDSGQPDAPITYAARTGEDVRLSGGQCLTHWEPVTDPRELDRLNPAARGQVWWTDLRAHGVTDLGVAATSDHQPGVPENRLEFIFRDQPMTVARWPNNGFAHIAETVGGDRYDAHGRTFDRIGRFTCEEARLERWAQERDVWLHGYWAWEWSEQRQPVAGFDLASRTISIAPPYHTYGYRTGQPFYAFNLLCELDEPGEWYLDRENGRLYFWPPAPVDRDTAVVSVIPTIIALQDASHVTVRGLVLEACRGNAVEAANVKDVWIEDCTIRNTGHYAITLTGKESGVRQCDISGTGSGGIWLSGGDRATLTPGHLRVEDTVIHHFARWHRAYHPGVRLEGVRHHVMHNRIHDAPHFGIWFHGNDHIIAFNEFHHLSMETSDTGAVYGGRDITALGHVIHHNYFHNLGSGDQMLQLVAGIYLDDTLGGVFVRDNIFVGTTWAGICINGGRDNTIENNIFLRCNSAVRGNNGDPVWFLWEFDGRKGYEAILHRLREMPYTEPPWSARYPELVERMRLWEKGEPWRAINNRVVRNLCVESPWEMNTPLYHFEGNWIVSTLTDRPCPVFRNAEHPETDGFALHPDSPLVNRGFRPIPFDDIGPRAGRGGQGSGPVIRQSG